MDFEIKRLLTFPWHIISNILHELDRSYIYEVFVYVPEIRELVIREFFTESRYVLRESSISDTWTQSICSPHSLDDIEEVTQFLEKDSDIVPRAAKILVYDMSYLWDLLERFRNHFHGIPELHLHILEPDIVVDDAFSMILESLKNLRTLQLERPELRCLISDPSSLSRLQNLETLCLKGHSINDWSGKALPPKLKDLKIFFGELHTMRIPEGVVSICWKVGRHNALDLSKVRFPPTLTSLSIQYERKGLWTFSQLPHTLKELRITNGTLRERHWTSQGVKHFPPNLEVLDLSNNHIEDDAISLFGFQLPKRLRELNLANNSFVNLYRLKPLPKTLKSLNLSGNASLSLQDPTNEDGPFFCGFPESLEKLDLSSCCGSRLDLSLIRASDKIKLPSALSNLNLDGVSEDYLKIFVLPPSLTHLSLENMGITDLTEYEDDLVNNPHATGSFAWRNLVNLKELKLGSNNITSLEEWVPPPNLDFLSLKRNCFARLSSSWPLFNKNHANRLEFLEELRFRKNKISKIDPEIWLPPNLETLSLDYNDLTYFAFTNGIIHGALDVLDLANNPIQSISAFTNQQARLRILNLEMDEEDEDMDNDEDNQYLEEQEEGERVAAFYRELRKMGIVPQGNEADSLKEFHWLQQMD